MAVVLYPFNVSVQGASHLRRELEPENAARGRVFPCQDRSHAAYCAADDVHRTAYYISCVCDGHGAAAYFRSAEEARLGVEALCRCVAQQVDSVVLLVAGQDAASDAALQSLAASVVECWINLVNEDLQKNPITEAELDLLAESDAATAARYRDGKDLRSVYGTTALACVVAEGCWFALQIGDGDIVLHTEAGGFRKPVPDDDRLFLNQTTSLCDGAAASEFRVARGTEMPDVVLCSSDGVANCFAGDGQLFEFYGKLIWLFRYWDGEEEADGNADVPVRFEAARKELERSLPDISRRGSGDDVSLAGYVGIDAEKVQEHVRCRTLIAQGRKAQEAGRLSEAAKDFVAAAEHGYPEGWQLLGALCERAGQRERAADAFAKAVAQGVVQAREPLGRLLYEEALEKQTAAEHPAAFALFDRAAQCGNREAQYALSLYYGRPQDYPGCGVRQNFAKAIDWTKKAARQGHPEAECKLGKCYRDGRGVQKDAELSREWYEKAAEHGSEEAKAYLAKLTL